MTSSTDPPDDIPTGDDDPGTGRDMRYACPSIEEIDASMEEIAPRTRPADPGPAPDDDHGRRSPFSPEIDPFPTPSFVTASDLVAADIPRRRWIMGRTLLRGSITGLVGGGAVGKSSLILGMAVSIITGQPLIGDSIHDDEKGGRCWVHNCEDDKDETLRRLTAILKHHNIPDGDIVDKVATSHGLEGRLTIAMKTIGGFIELPHVANCIKYIKDNNIAFAAFDPFIGMTRGINENDNADVDAVCDGFRRIAFATGASILVAQHTGKPPRGKATDPLDPNVSRGAIAFINGCRITQQLTTLDEAMADELGVAKVDAFRYLRRDDGKTNFSLKTGEALAFYHRETVDLDNGDQVGVIITADIGKKDETGTVANIQLRVDERALISAINIREMNGTRFLMNRDPKLSDWMARSPRNWKPKRFATVLSNCHHEGWIKYVNEGRNRGYHLTPEGRAYLNPTPSSST